MDASQEIIDRAGKISLVLMDSDGVLTDGRILMYSDGSEGRGFSVRDGHGIRMGQRGGLMFGIVSGRESRVVADRAEELYITEVHQGIFDKVERYKEILERFARFFPAMMHAFCQDGGGSLASSCWRPESSGRSSP